IVGWCDPRRRQHPDGSTGTCLLSLSPVTFHLPPPDTHPPTARVRSCIFPHPVASLALQHNLQATQGGDHVCHPACMLHAGPHGGLLHRHWHRLLHLQLLTSATVAPVRRERAGDTSPGAGDD